MCLRSRPSWISIPKPCRLVRYGYSWLKICPEILWTCSVGVIRQVKHDSQASRHAELFPGAYYDIDPLFFLSHIDDYLFHHTRDRWAKLPNLDVEARNMTHFNLQYLRARYFETEGDFTAAEKESGLFNVLRRLDSDRSRKQLQGSLLDQKAASVTLTRAKTSLWIQPRGQNDPVTGAMFSPEKLLPQASADAT